MLSEALQIAEDPLDSGSKQGLNPLASSTSVTSVSSGDAQSFFQRAKAGETPLQKGRAKESARVFSIMQYETHPVSGETMITQAQIDKLLAMGSVKRWAYAWHRSDIYTEEEAQEERFKGKSVKGGDAKGDHVHIAIECHDNYTVRQISNWGEIPSARVRRPKEETAKTGTTYQGAGAREKAFFDFCQYLTHEGSKQKSKHQYPREVVVANFDFSTELDAHLASRAPGGKNGGQKKLEELMLAVMFGRMTLRHLRRHHPVEYGKNIDSFKKWRGDFLMSQEPPRLRVNHYIGGRLGAELLGRTGKSTLARLMARTLYPDLDAAECYYEATDKRVPLQNYAGQPVIIWDDYTPVDLMEALGGRTGVWQVFADRPGVTDANIKYGSVRLVQEVNIITRVTPYRQYFDALAGDYTDRSGNEHHAEAPEQAWGRFAFASEVTSDTFSFLVNQSFVSETPEYRDFRKIAIMRASMKAIGQHLDSIESDEEREAAMYEVGDVLLGQMIGQHKALQPLANRTKDEALADLLPTLEVLTGDAMEQYETDFAIQELIAAEAAKARAARQWDVPGLATAAYTG